MSLLVGEIQTAVQGMAQKKDTLKTLCETAYTFVFWQFCFVVLRSSEQPVLCCVKPILKLNVKAK